jgi:hypothetical protein
VEAAGADSHHLQPGGPGTELLLRFARAGHDAGYRLRATTGASAAIILVGIAATLVVLAFFVVDTFRNAPQTFTAIVIIAALAVALDVVWKRARGPLPPIEAARDASSAPV